MLRKAHAAGAERRRRYADAGIPGMRAAIDAKCIDCSYDPQCGGGSWRQQIAACTVTLCPLWPYRPGADPAVDFKPPFKAVTSASLLASIRSAGSVDADCGADGEESPGSVEGPDSGGSPDGTD